MDATEPRTLSLLDFLAVALKQHDRELNSLGDKLQESIKLLNNERFIEKYVDPITMKADTDAIFMRIDEMIKAFQTMERRMQRSEARSVELGASTDLPSSQTKTLRALSYDKRMTVREVMSLTGRSRALETIYLNQLVRLSLVVKTKEVRKHYYCKKLLRQPLIEEKGSKKVMILVLVSENAAGEAQKDVRELVSRRLSSLKEWQLEQSTILSR